MEALKRANDIRVKRAQLKKDLKVGRAKIDKILNNPPEYVATAKVFAVDLWSLSGFVRVGSVAALGVSLLVAAFLFERLVLRSRSREATT